MSDRDNDRRGEMLEENLIDPRLKRLVHGSGRLVEEEPVRFCKESAGDGNALLIAAGKALDRYGNPLTIKLTGAVEPYFKDKKPG